MMYINFSKRMKSIAGINYTVGYRITRRNAPYMFFFISQLYMWWLIFKLLVYLAWFGGFLVFKMYYLYFLLFKKMYQGTRFIVMKLYNFAKKQILKKIAERNEATYGNDYPQYKE